MKPLPEKLPEDLNELKALIDERLAVISANNSQVATINQQSDAYQKEVALLQDEVLILSGVKARKNMEGISESVDGELIEHGKKEEKERVDNLEATPTP